MRLELIFHEKVLKLLDDLTETLKISVVFFDADGNPLQRGGRSKTGCEYCRLIQNRIFSLADCENLDREKQRKCSESRQWETYVCHGGLCEIIAPIVSEGKMVGFLIFGQFRTSDAPPEEVRTRCGAESRFREACAAFQNVPRFAPREVLNLTGLLESMVDYILSRELIQVRGDTLFEPIRRYAEQNFKREVTLKELARHLGRSESFVTHFLKDRESFKAMLIRLRLEEAERILKSKPGVTVKEAAAEAGFEDHYYFSRIYRKRRGCTPGEFLRKNHGKN